MGQKLNFSIDHIDPLGQGVHKDESGVFFIPKTLPGDTGIAEVIKRSKGVSFARLLELQTRSEKRIEPECKHFTDCPGCQFLHTDYNFELETKKKSLLRMLKPIEVEDVKIHAAPRRFAYRNRMQLHYDLNLSRLGMQTPDGIVEIPECKLPNARLASAYKELQSHWPSLVIDQPKQGHIEIYTQSNASVQTSINKPYADGGFTQVFAQMNEEAISVVKDFTSKLSLKNCLDLFGGAGNLSKHLTVPTLVVDGTIPSLDLATHQEFFQLNLYSNSAVHSLQQKQASGVDLMLVDPPRSGFVGLEKFIEAFDPKYLVYMSCFAPTMVRDLKNIKMLKKEIHLLDFFPSTHHLETLALIQLK
ncbi:MAG: hypothetical protein COV38_09140 [Bdellovibrionales bacterium CG11_big_fil_rev_8_21_14_0_20_38_13]|nr:MAG: hypothetical protein COW79_01755 [Bdellovibrionales bacterium CG22_combo_CG10-13_8_21_14_all_38_13]PIR29726.1 MAG: hypothetical protein COV38_09140 [Bdellovibrionales bacterium CG11_big_fil_rev_8_21_14_0_20_38_13]